ncbi:MAG: nitrogenase iron protein, partial [Eubacteriales bacterium]
PDIVIYDVLGDVVCGGFAMPIRDGYAKEVFIVSSGEMMALYAADNICRAIKNFEKRSYAKVGGLILNAKNIENERAIVETACLEMNTSIVKEIPRCGDIQVAENAGGTVFEYVPDSSMTTIYNELAEQILARTSDN